MSDLFHTAVDLVIGQEGGYSCDPGDPGQETRWGICKRSYPSTDILHLTRDEAVALYHWDFWEPLNLDQVPSPIAVAVFDGAVNQGRRPAVRMLQTVLGVGLDGVLGVRTIAASRLAALPDALHRYMACRAVYYAHLATFGTFGRGWMTRLFTVHRACLALMEDGGGGASGTQSV